jgi:DNA topoisomerase-3
MRVFIAEKPSLARAIAEALPGAKQRRDGYIECSNGDVVAWCAGHILELAAPDAYDPAFKEWRLEHLPISPGQWKLVVTAPDLLRTIASLVSRATVVVNAGDPDREGQLLVDEVIGFVGYRGRVDRVLISDLNVDAVRKAIEKIGSNANYKNLYEAAVARQRADWLYGLNMTRLYTVLGRNGGYEGVLSVGRVQTPLLGLIVCRDLEIEGFVPTPYYEVVGELAGAARPFSATWQPGSGVEHALDSDGRLLSASIASEVQRKTAGQVGSVTKADQEKKGEPPPLPFSLPELQVEAGRRLSMSPKDTLETCQALYETHRLITYPRSDCSFLPEGHHSQARAVSRVVESVEPALAEVVWGADWSLRSRAWNDSKVTAHHAIIPAPRVGATTNLSVSERALYELIARRYLAQFFPPFEYYQLQAEILVVGERFVARGREPIVQGWRGVLSDDGGPAEEDQAKAETALTILPPLATGQRLRVAEIKVVEKQTQPPRRFTSATLVRVMTGIARFVSDPAIRRVLRETDGIGTPATQAAIIQTLFERKYIEESKRQIVSTETGRALVRSLPDVATKPDMTALWEAALRKIEQGRAPLDKFLAALASQISELVRTAIAGGPLRLPGVEARPCPSPGCTGYLRARTGRNGKFLSCSRYPDCTHTAEPTSAQVTSRPSSASQPVRRFRNRRRRTERHEPTSPK